MRATELLVVGPAGKQTGGIARYIHEQRRRLESEPRIYDVAVPDSETTWEFLRAVVLAVVQLLRFPFQRAPDVVHVHTSHWYSFFQSSAYVFYAAFVWRVPVVLHIHGSSFDSFVDSESRLLGAFQALVFDQCTTVVVLSEYWSDVVGGHVEEEKLFVLPNAVDPDDYDPQYDATPPHVAFVSNHIPRKGIEEFVAAVDDLLDEGVRMRVTIAGAGPLSHRSEALAARRAAVTYEGYVTEARKREILNEASVFVLPTHAENLPIVLLEAMAGGNALVSTTVGAIPSLVDDDNGVLVAPGDEQELRTALSTLLADPARIESMARTSRVRAEREYSWRTAVDALEGLYRELAH